jgi:site-specific recombinase XerD
MSVTLREKQLKDKTIRFYLDIYHNKKRSYKFLDVKIDPKIDSRDDISQKRELVKVLRSQLELELITEGTGYTPNHKKNIDFYDYLEAYTESYVKKDHKMIKATIQKFMDFNNKDYLYVTEITEQLCERYRDYLCSDKSGLSGESPHNYFSRFKKILKAAYKEKIIKTNPAWDVKFINHGNKDTLKKNVLELDELLILSNTYCGNNQVKQAFLFCCLTGLGLAEIKILNWSHIVSDRLIIERLKTGIIINIELAEKAKKIIGEKKLPTDLIFDISISDTAVNKNIDNWVKKAGIDKKITFYCGRHTYATLLLKGGANLKTVSDLMGQTGVKHTVKYLNHIDELHKTAINTLPNF